ncbi:bifunctional (p)ppGpp synthetase/guanosine-3',5'-bis(diphosphate) 3'-pyrophosphohydrolase [Pseudomonas syringae]|nr:bifunctional (p)ppGpp synthetase/guanosine-3',5'-bis(diphosphate) 3'-pyrophosphohydrolase [Pseudomonas syringae]
MTRVAWPRAECDKREEKANPRTAEERFAALGAGDRRQAQMVNLAQQQVEPDRVNEQMELIPRKATGYKPGKRGDIQIQSVGNLMTQMAGCCQPLPGDARVGCSTRGRGVSNHRRDGTSVRQLGGLQS